MSRLFITSREIDFISDITKEIKKIFRTYFRTSANSNLTITPASMQNVTIDIDYISKNQTQETLTVELSLKYSVLNSSPSESNLSIKQNAPALYYTQNRMITAEDYNIIPLTTSQEIVKTKSVNRTSSGISRYFDLVDATGKYSKTNIYGNDGVLYKEYYNDKQGFTFSTKSDIENVILNTIQPILATTPIRNFYYDKFNRKNLTLNNYKWVSTGTATNQSSGYFVDGDLDDLVLKVGTFTSTNLKNLTIHSMVKFTPPDGYIFDKENNNRLVSRGVIKTAGQIEYLWTKVVTITGEGDTNDSIVFSDIVPENAVISQIIPNLSNAIESDIQTQMIDRIYTYKTFALRYDSTAERWKVITEDNINFANDFSEARGGDTSNQGLDASWMLLFETNGESYTITVRSLRYVFESDKEVRFFFDNRDKVYDPKTGKTQVDTIRVLNINTILDTDNLYPLSVDYDWEVSNTFRDGQGYISSKKVEVTFFDSDDDGVVDDPDTFTQIVLPEISPQEKYILLEKYSPSNEVEDYRYTAGDDVIFVNNLNIVPSQYNEGQIFFNTASVAFYVLENGVLRVTDDYKAYVGRKNVKFHYIHNADETYRIDPSSTNIIDTYLLTKTYDTEYRKYISGINLSEPLPLSSDQMYLNFGQTINAQKSISDEVIYHPVKYKPLFGSKAGTELQAKFKVVKNNDIVLTDNQIKSEVIQYVNEFFSLENWDFGDTFFFQELATYITVKMTPNIHSIVIVPQSTNQSFGSLFEVKAENDEIFISAAQVDDVEIISGITATSLKATGDVVTSSNNSSIGIPSIDTDLNSGGLID